MPILHLHLLILHVLAEKNGKTLHLLKSGSKPTQLERKRKKIPVLGSFEQFTDSKKKPVPKTNQPHEAQDPSQISSGSSILQFMAPAPTGKANAGKGKDAHMSGK